ncbi:MAG: hypothetical protein WCX64_06985 [Candidatus Micrarchaeia archaeon]
MAYSVVRKCDDGTLVLRPDSKEPVQKGTPIHFRLEKAGAIIETIGRVSDPLVVAQVAKKFADEKEFQ